MGYESRLYLGTCLPHCTSTVYKTDDESEETNEPLRKAIHTQVVAMVDLCKVGYESPVYNVLQTAREAANAVAQSGEPTHGLYVGGRFRDRDSYDDALAPVDVSRLISAMTEEHKAQPYRRFEIALPLLRAWSDSTSFPGAVVLHYGY